MSEKELIDAAKSRFDTQLHTAEYKKIHSDDDQLNRLINLVDIKSGRQYLDIGAGNGYVAFSLAKRFPNIQVWGLDIASDSITKNNKIRESEKIQNISFRSYITVSVMNILFGKR